MERSSSHDPLPRHHHHHHHHHLKCPSQRLENIKEDDGDWLPPAAVAALRPPETPTETMEFLARSWSLTALDLSRALGDAFHPHPTADDGTCPSPSAGSAPAEKIPPAALQPVASAEPFVVSPPISPRDTADLKLLRGAPRGKTKGGWLRDHQERKRAEARSRKAQAYAAASVAGVAAVVAAVAAGTVFSPDVPGGQRNAPSSKLSAAIASAAALVASHCVEMAHVMGARRDQILTVIRSAVNAQTAGDIMTLTAGAATALRGASTLSARIPNENQGAALTGENKDSGGCQPSSALAFVYNGGQLLKRTRKGILHWKQVSIYTNSSWQVVVKMKSTHMAGTFVKKKKSVVTDVCSDVAAWPGREAGDGGEQRAYFGIRTPERLIEFECTSKCEKQKWIDGIRQMLDCRANMNIVMPM